MRKIAIRGQALVCVILSFLGLVNHGVWIWMTGKTKQKKLQLVGISTLILCIVSVMFAGVIKDERVSSVISFVAVVSIFGPTIFNCLYIRTFMNCQSLWSLIDKYQIRVNELDVDAYSNIQVNPDDLTAKNSRRLFGEKGNAVLRAIQFKEWENRELQERRKWEAERRKRQKKIEMEKAKAEAERMHAEAESKKMETEKAKAEVERMHAEAESKKMEMERVKAEAEKMRAEAEAKRMEAEKMRAETELKKIEKERAQKDRTEDRNKHREMQAANAESAEGNRNRSNNKKLDINLCTEQELSLVPGIGIILAKKAIRIRNVKGMFSSVDEFIQEVGIRGNNENMIRSNLVCTQQSSQYTESSIKKRGRKIDL